MEEGVLYADLRFPSTPAPQQRVRLPWCWAALSLGLLSLMLLLAQIILVSLSFHYLVQQQTSCTDGLWRIEESPSYGKQTLEGRCQFCPVGWLWDAGQCYYFSSAKKNWEQSREDCCSRGAQLVTIQANTTLAFLVRTANMDAFHVGLKQDGFRSEWKWLDGTTLEWCLSTQYGLSPTLPPDRNGEGQSWVPSWTTAAGLPAWPRVGPTLPCSLLRPPLAAPMCPADPSEDDIHYKKLLQGLVLTVASLGRTQLRSLPQGYPRTGSASCLGPPPRAQSAFPSASLTVPCKPSCLEQSVTTTFL
ncbi:killer cell lectin-like receptor subfamily G member 1 isoform X2 [Motacilla alba alba]|uniref:killer cell lectin-like receptor subfamily G member 1 isoform X2 n=1 Tax=Motacilla alba alba TaxID=1094192 RepID=UPI0018D4F724|nr:killer cell lectin-like receptor subfamily G member 1 isoform X2 [Motacilla alba alba]